MDISTGITKNKRLAVLCLLILLSFIQYPTIVSASDNDSLIMGIFPRRDALMTIANFTPLAQYLSKKLNHNVKLETNYNFESFWADIKNKKYDIVHFNQYHYIRAHKEYGYNVFAMNEEYGRSTISSVIITNANENIEDLAQLKNKTFAFGGGPMAMISHILPLYTLHQNKLISNQFKSIFTKNPKNAVMAVYFDKANAAGIGDSLLETLSMSDKNIDTKNFATIAKSEAIMQLPWALRGDMPYELRQKIQSIFISLNTEKSKNKILESAKLTGFVIATNSDYNRTREIVHSVLGVKY